jgi:hypothetical protein
VNPKKIAVISDVHANKAALKAVMDDAAVQQVQRFWMLGDLAGRGCDPIGTVSTLRRLYNQQKNEDRVFWLTGNHDRNILNLWYRAQGHEDTQLAGFLMDSESGSFVGSSTGDSRNTVLVDQWHYDLFTLSTSDRSDLLEWLDSLPSYCIAASDSPYAGIATVHAALQYTDGCLSDYGTYMAYLMGDRGSMSPFLIQRQFDDLGDAVRLVLAGHTHMSGIWRADGDNGNAEAIPDGEPVLLDLSAHRYYINVGSVGFPRRHDTCPTYYILTWDTAGVLAEKRYVRYVPDVSKCSHDYPPEYRDEMSRCD